MSIIQSNGENHLGPLLASLPGVQQVTGSNDQGSKFLIIREECVSLDVTLLSHAFCRDRISFFEKGVNVSNTVQDLLWNLCHGIRIYETGNPPEYAVHYTSAAYQAVLSKFLQGLGLHKLDVHYQRCDWVQVHEATLSISKVLINLGYALNRELFWGYKHIHTRTERFPAYITNALIALQNVNVRNWKTSISDLERQILAVRAIANAEIANG